MAKLTPWQIAMIEQALNNEARQQVNPDVKESIGRIIDLVHEADVVICEYHPKITA